MSRAHNKKIAGRRMRLLLSGSFLLTFLLWVLIFSSGATGVAEYVIVGILSVVLAAFTFEWVASGVAILLIPVFVLVRFLKDLARR